jgi:hypothetical protein
MTKRSSPFRSNETDILGIYGNGVISAYQNSLSLTDSISNVSCILLTNPGTDISGLKRIATTATVSSALMPGIGSSVPRLIRNGI